MSVQDDVVAGAIGGLAGGMAMSLLMAMGKQAGLVQTPVPVKVERWAEQRVGVAVPSGSKAEGGVSMAGHLAFSAALGAGYGLLRPALPRPTVVGGALYGLGAYAANLAGVGPMLGMTRGPWHAAPLTVGRRVMLHLVYGAVTALVAQRLQSR